MKCQWIKEATPWLLPRGDGLGHIVLLNLNPAPTPAINTSLCSTSHEGLGLIHAGALKVLEQPTQRNNSQQ
jgi:hypothetical protein